MQDDDFDEGVQPGVAESIAIDEIKAAFDLSKPPFFGKKKFFNEKLKSILSSIGKIAASEELQQQVQGDIAAAMEKSIEPIVRNCARRDRKKLYAVLGEMKGDKRFKFLAGFFTIVSGNRENDIWNKATLVSEMLATEEFTTNPALKRILDRAIPASGRIFSGSRPSDYAEIERDLEKERAAVLKRGKKDQAEPIENVLQVAYQEEFHAELRKRDNLITAKRLKVLLTTPLDRLIDEFSYDEDEETYSQDELISIAQNLRTSVARKLRVVSERLEGEARVFMESLVARNKLADMLENQPSNEETLSEFFKLYATMDRSHLDLMTAPPMNIAKLQDLLRLDIYDKRTGEVKYEKLRGLARLEGGDKLCVSLLKLAFKEEGEENAVRKAALVYSMIAAKGNHVFKGDVATPKFSKHLRYVLSWPRYAITKVFTLGLAGGSARAYTARGIRGKLDAEIKATKIAVDAIALDDILQIAFKSSLEAKYKCLSSASTEDFGELKKELRAGFALTKFEFAADSVVDPKVQAYVTNITKRNRLASLIKNKAVDELLLEDFVKEYKEMDPGYLSEPPIDLKKLKSIIQLDIFDPETKKIKESSYKLLKGLDDERLSALLRFYFSKEKEGTKKAFIVSRMIKNEAFFSDENSVLDGVRTGLLKEAMLGKASYSKMFYHLENIRTTAKKRVEDIERGNIELVLQQAMQDDIESRYRPQDMAAAVWSGELFRGVSNNYDLRTFDVEGYISRGTEGAERRPGERLLDDMRSQFNYICNRNIIYDLIKKHKRDKKLNSDDLERFAAACKEFKNPADLRRALKDLNDNKKITPKDILSALKSDIGTHSGRITSKIASFECKQLRALDLARREELLTWCFNPYEKSEKKARRKAALISGLLDTLELGGTVDVDPKDPVVNLIYWSMVNPDKVKADDVERKLNELLDAGKLTERQIEIFEAVPADQGESTTARIEDVIMPEKRSLGDFTSQGVGHEQEEGWQDEDDDDDEFYHYDRKL